MSCTDHVIPWNDRPLEIRELIIGHLLTLTLTPTLTLTSEATKAEVRATLRLLSQTSYAFSHIDCLQPIRSATNLLRTDQDQIFSDIAKYCELRLFEETVVQPAGFPKMGLLLRKSPQLPTQTLIYFPKFEHDLTAVLAFRKKELALILQRKDLKRLLGRLDLDISRDAATERSLLPQL